MKAAWYERQGPAASVLVGEMTTPEPGLGEVRIRVAASGISPGDVKKRQDAFGVGMPFPRVVPHSDGAGVIESVGHGISDARVGGGRGVSARRAIGRSVRPPSTSWCRPSRQSPFQAGSRLSRGRVWAFPGSRRTAPSMRPAPWTVASSSCKGVPGPSGSVPSASPGTPVPS